MQHAIELLMNESFVFVCFWCLFSILVLYELFEICGKLIAIVRLCCACKL